MALTAVIKQEVRLQVNTKIDLRLSPERKILLVASESELHGKVVMMANLSEMRLKLAGRDANLRGYPL